jgi:protein-disulfide isomerase
MTDAEGPTNSAPVTVVGYPDHAPVATGQSVPGLAAVKMSISSLRALAIVTLVLVLILTAGLALGILSLRSQVSSLSQQLAALQTSAPVGGTAQESAPADGGSAQQSGVAQLPSAPELPGGVPRPTGVDATGAIVIGDPNAANVVEVYVDYQCPFCQRWEQEIGEVLAERALSAGSDVVIKQYNLAFLGETSATLEPPGSSARAASAALCVIEGEGPAAFATYNARIFQVADRNASNVQFSTDQMAQLAADLGASPDTIACIEQERHVTFVALSTQSGFGRGVQGTPTVVVNGRNVENSFADPELLALVG